MSELLDFILRFLKLRCFISATHVISHPQFNLSTSYSANALVWPGAQHRLPNSNGCFFLRDMAAPSRFFIIMQSVYPNTCYTSRNVYHISEFRICSTTYLHNTNVTVQNNKRQPSGSTIIQYGGRYWT